jgi:hypothetical protein
MVAMTKQRLLQQPRIKNTLHFLEYGMVDLIQAVDAISQYYRDGALDHESATEAIRLLAKVKTPKEV